MPVRPGRIGQPQVAVPNATCVWNRTNAVCNPRADVLQTKQGDLHDRLRLDVVVLRFARHGGCVFARQGGALSVAVFLQQRCGEPGQVTKGGRCRFADHVLVPPRGPSGHGA